MEATKYFLRGVAVGVAVIVLLFGIPSLLAYAFLLIAGWPGYYFVWPFAVLVVLNLSGVIAVADHYGVFDEPRRE